MRIFGKILAVLTVFLSVSINLALAQEPPKNQTPAESFKALSQKADIVGTGLFLVPDPAEGAIEQRVVVVPNLKYGESAIRGQNSDAFMWIAESVMSLDEINSKRAEPLFCNGFWGAGGFGCDFPCFCGNGNYCR
ncbi:hypothetical protein IWQ51_005212 [Labrenzia sp. EL_142]|nr:hypothetical protein [Labrenzia sp. EL_142]